MESKLEPNYELKPGNQLKPVPEIKPGRNISLKVVGITLLLMVVALVTGAWFYWQYLLQPLNPGSATEITVNIAQGATGSQVSSLLETRGIIRSGLAFRLHATLEGKQGSVIAGNYKLSPAMNLDQILQNLISGKVALVSFTIPEGLNLNQITDVLVKKGLVDRDKFKQVLAGEQFNYDFLQGIPAGQNRLEGYLFPATYQIHQGSGEKEIVDMMLKRFAREITPDFRSKAKALGLTTHQAVTLASIVEREAARDKERPEVAAVFLNRIRQNMRLESCATVQYALGVNKSRLYYKDLQVASPYNTYKIFGLPPGPIAVPGHPSLQAAVNPAKVDYLYFVVSQQGEHAFSKTLAEHVKNKQKYTARFQTP